MAWLTKESASQRHASGNVTHHTFDIPVKLQVRGAAEPIAATLLHVTVSGARIRSWMHMERGARISFDWSLADGRKLRLNGAVAARYVARNGGPGFEYAVAFDGLAEADGDALAREAALLSQRSASARSYDTSLVDISGFTNYRVADDFAVSYRADDVRATPRMGRACDVTGSGMRLRCEQRLRSGETLLLSFTLPEHVLDVHKGKDDEFIAGPFGYRRVARKQLRRPFTQLRVKVRVLGSVKDSRRNDAYEVQFLELDGISREELARYIHAAQLRSLRR